MITYVYNLGYFMKEVARIIMRNFLSNLMSVISTTFIIFLLGLVLTGWAIGDRMVTMLTEEAEISAYFDKDIQAEEANQLVEAIKRLQGVWDANIISERQAKERMEEILGEEAHILELFDENPFESYIEVRIQLQDMDIVLQRVGNMKGVSYVRDNRELLNQLQGIINGLKLLGIMIIITVGITTMIILSHLIRQGIYHHRHQINTLRLLGAPDSFIGLPFVLTGILLTLIGGVLAMLSIVLLIDKGYSQLGGVLPFLPMPTKRELIEGVKLTLPAVSLVLGLLGSLFGLSSIRRS